MIRSFRNQQSADVFNGVPSKKAARVRPLELWGVAARKLDQINRATALEELNVSRGNRLKPLQRNREGHHSIRINDQYRICFRWADDGAHDVEITDYHWAVAERPCLSGPRGRGMYA